MSAVNFLPTEEKNKALAEEKQNILAKEKAEIKLSSPVLSSKPNPAPAPLPQAGPFSFFKKIFSKSKKITPPVPVLVPRPPVISAGSRPVEAVENQSGNNLPNNNFVPASPKPVVPPVPSPSSGFLNQKTPLSAPSLAPQEIVVAPMGKPASFLSFKPAEPAPKTNGQVNQVKEKEKKDLDDKLKHEFSINLISEDGRAKELNAHARLAIFLIVTCGLILFFGALFFSFDFRVKNTMNKTLALESQNKLLQTTIKKQMADNQAASSLQSRLVELEKILEKHFPVSKIFKYLEENTNLGVYYTDLNAEVSDRAIKIDAVALDYSAAAKQLLILEKDTVNIESVKMTALSKDKEKSNSPNQREEDLKDVVSFGLEITFSESFFRN